AVKTFDLGHVGDLPNRSLLWKAHRNADHARWRTYPKDEALSPQCWRNFRNLLRKSSHFVAAVATTEEQEGSTGVAHLQVDDSAQHDPVVAGVVDPLDGAFDPGDHVVDHRRAGAPRTPTDRGELVGALAREHAAHVFLVLAEDVDAERACRLDLR